MVKRILQHFSEDAVNKYDFHIFELILCNTKNLPAVIEERNFTSGVFLPLVISEQF